jgi:hypothetical protein
VCAVQRAWGLKPHQKITPGLAEKLCFTVSATGSYEEAAQVAGKWSGLPVDDSTLHSLVQRMGGLAEEQRLERAARPPKERQPKRAASALGVLLVDGWQVRHRGAGWGRRRTIKPRVEWHEMKTGVFICRSRPPKPGAGGDYWKTRWWSAWWESRWSLGNVCIGRHCEAVWAVRVNSYS